MDLDKIVRSASEYVGEYLHVFFATLRQPTVMFKPVQLPSTGISLDTTRPETETARTANPRLISFALVSIFIGKTLYMIGASNVDGSNAAPSWIIHFVFTFTFWISIGAIAHLSSRMLAGKGDLLTTMTITIQVLAVTYVVSSFAGMIARVILRGLGYRNTMIFGMFTVFLVMEMTRFLLLAVYLPPALRETERLTTPKAVLLSSCVALGLLVGNLLLYSAAK
jgi:hypothetical protein